ncbi:hypothetical protein KKA15_03605 [Patescibacteria group bacterium]|nr:hypothetical protein [Patescibacteria group bacterium]
MNAAELIVKHWYQNKGYFTMESVRLARNKELDLVLVKLSEDGKKIVDKIHVEVQVANNFVNFGTPAEQMAKEYHQKKYISVKPAVEELLGTDYRMVEVRGKMALGSKDIRDEYIKLRKNMDVEVIPFETILKDVQNDMLTNIQSDPVIQAIQLVKFQCAE